MEAAFAQFNRCTEGLRTVAKGFEQVAQGLATLADAATVLTVCAQAAVRADAE